MENSTSCAIPTPSSVFRFVFLTCGSLIAFIGIFWNLLLTRIFMYRKTFEPNLVLLALLDSVLCFSYIALFGAEVWANYLKIEVAHTLLFWWNIPLFAVSRAIQLAIPALLILASLERWATISNRKFGNWSVLHKAHGKGIISLILVLLALASRSTINFSIRVQDYQNCSDHFRSKELWPTKLGLSQWYHNYDIFLTFLQVFVPFVLLLLLNLATVSKFRSRRKHRQDTITHLVLNFNRRHLSGGRGQEDGMNYLAASVASNLENDLRDTTVNEQNAVFTMAIIVTTYLICNTLHVALTIVERWAVSVVKNSNGWTKGYITASDTVCFLFMLSSVIRLLIYYRFHPVIRCQLKKVIIRPFGRYHKHRENSVCLTAADTLIENEQNSDDFLPRRKEAQDSLMKLLNETSSFIDEVPSKE